MYAPTLNPFCVTRALGNPKKNQNITGKSSVGTSEAGFLSIPVSSARTCAVNTATKPDGCDSVAIVVVTVVMASFLFRREQRLRVARW